MSKNVKSPTKFNEFPPVQDDKSVSVGQFLSKFFRITKYAENEEQATTSDSSSQETLPTWAADTSIEGRSLPNVLKRISNLLALKTNNLQDYANTELKQYWMPDSVSKECYECSEKFTTFRRRHHCRVCGQIFCSQCCNQQIPGKIFGCTGDLRVCTYCCKVVLSYLQSSELGADLSTDLKALQENLQSKFGEALSPNAFLAHDVRLNASEGTSSRSRPSLGYQEEKFASGGCVTYLTTEEKCRALQNSASLRNLFEEICKPTTGVQLESRRHRLKNYTDCFFGSELVDWLIFQQKAKTRVQAAAICQALLEGGYVECVAELSAFKDGDVLYKIGQVSPVVANLSTNFDVPLQEEPSWVQQIPHESSTTDSDNEQPSPVNLNPRISSSSSYMLNLNVEANTVYLSRPPESTCEIKSPIDSEVDFQNEETAAVRPSEQRELMPESGWFNALSLRDENGEKDAYTLLTEAYEQHEQSFLKQLLASKGLSLHWSDVITPLIHDVITIIRPDKNHDAVDLDIRHYVQFKKLSGGDKSDTCFIGGVVCSKNVAHKDMAVDIESPRILLLECAIVYQRTEGRLMSLEPILMQEHEYLRHVVARIVALQPDVVLVQRNVSRLALDMLRLHKITLVHNIKQTVLERLARCTQADIVSAVDAHIGRPKLGTCKRFYLRSFNIERGGHKTLMFFEGLPSPYLGGTVLLRGASKKELSRLKSVASLLLFTAYNWRLEKSFLMDEFALPPDSKCEFLDDSHENSPSSAMPKVRLGNDDNSKEEEEAKKIPRNVKSEVKSENRKVVPEAIEDFTDPLQSADAKVTVPANGVKEKLSVAKLPFSNSFRKALDDRILSVSPYIMFSVPYLETDLGKKCKLRGYFPEEIYYSEQFNSSVKNKRKEVESGEDIVTNEDKEMILPLHPFLTTKITTSVEDSNIQNLLADFRACGGRCTKKEFIWNVPREEKKNVVVGDNRKDVLDPNNHQRLAVLFCSFSSESNNAPAFCVNPWVVYMDFYGRNDIPLGCFLERYCFRSTYTCPSKSCDTPMVKHVRRFVHNQGCVSISLNYFQAEVSEESIVTWTWCTKCQDVSPVVPISTDTWSFSFAKYLELKFHTELFNRRGQSPCEHSLHHDHFQYFGYKNYVASFKYTSVNIWEVSLPSQLITTTCDLNKLQMSLIDDIRVLSQKGHEIFSLIQDRLSCQPVEDLEGNGSLKQQLSKEQTAFKQKIEEVQLKLTSPSIESKDFEEKELYTAYCRISDNLIKIKRSVIETVDCWNQRLSEAVKKRDDKKKEKTVITDLESPTMEATETPLNVSGVSDFDEREQMGALAKKMRSLDSSEGDVTSSPKSHHRSQSEGTTSSQSEETTDNKKDSDKKTVKDIILDKLLPSSNVLSPIPPPFSMQEHYTLPVEKIFNIVVYEQEPSSIVAYALNSTDYKKQLDELQCKKNTSAEHSPSPVSRKKAGDKEKMDNEEKTPGLLKGLLRNKEAKASETGSPNSSIASSLEVTPGEQPISPDKNEKTRNSHIEIQFHDANCNFFCRVYLAEKFATLRTAVLPFGEEEYIRSLSRSVQWKARGGKSGSNFAKTADDRYILKEMSKSEVQLFVESASNYFAYIHKCCATKQATLLGKIVGIYQIIFKNNNSNVTLRTNLLVMENLFYNREVTQKFDLKGSMRNRLVVPENQEGEIVLLDENLLKMTCDSPLYILPHSKAVLTAAIQNDTEFLASQSVMDYSLLVGLDSQNKELVLGIIDYIRTFTWDKKLETMVKKSGILGGQGKLPTIVSPEEYQKRFIEAMHRYFLEVPDRWAGLGKLTEF